MHLGLLYPYLWEFWQCELQFWPGFVPRKLHISCATGYGTSWDRLAPGIVTNVGVPDSFATGDPYWEWLDAINNWKVDVLIHKTGINPTVYSWGIRVQEIGIAVSSQTYGFMAGPQYVFANPVWAAVSTFPPYSLGIIPPIVIRPATWSEV